LRAKQGTHIAAFQWIAASTAPHRKGKQTGKSGYTMWQDLMTGFSIYLIIEGMIPFAGPKLFRQSVVRIAQMDDNSLRFTGLAVAGVGLIMLYIVR
jgi:uncharacterized protein YjeT (DUF2065 family)